MKNKIMPEQDKSQYLVAVGLDGSESSWKAVREAIKQAALHQGVLHIVSIQEFADSSYNASEVLEAEKTTHEKLERNQNKARDEAESAGLTVKTVIVTGTSAAALVDYVKQKDINLLVIGETGHSSFLGALLGTNVEKIAKNAPCSVLIVR